MVNQATVLTSIAYLKILTSVLGLKARFVAADGSVLRVADFNFNEISRLIKGMR